MLTEAQIERGSDAGRSAARTRGGAGRCSWRRAPQIFSVLLDSTDRHVECLRGIHGGQGGSGVAGGEQSRRNRAHLRGGSWRNPGDAWTRVEAGSFGGVSDVEAGLLGWSVEAGMCGRGGCTVAQGLCAAMAWRSVDAGVRRRLRGG